MQKMREAESRLSSSCYDEDPAFHKMAAGQWRHGLFPLPQVGTFSPGRVQVLGADMDGSAEIRSALFAVTDAGGIQGKRFGVVIEGNEGEKKWLKEGCCRREFRVLIRSRR